jgi:hypothetical protein
MIRTQHTSFTDRQPDTPEHLPAERGSRFPSRAVGLLRRFGLVAGVAGVALAAITPVASATTFGDFSPFIPPSTRYVDDCTVKLGPVFDSWSSSYRKIGGVQVNCNSVHPVIKATVWQQYWNGSTAVNVGTSTVGVRYNQSGSGAGILRSGAVCGSRYYFRTAALVQTDRTGAYLYSDWSPTPAGGC